MNVITHFSTNSAVSTNETRRSTTTTFRFRPLNGRVECDYILPNDPECHPQTYLEDGDYEFRMTTLQRRDGEWFLYQRSRRIPRGDSRLHTDGRSRHPKSNTKHSTALSVDLGVNNIARYRLNRRNVMP